MCSPNTADGMMPLVPSRSWSSAIPTALNGTTSAVRSTPNPTAPSQADFLIEGGNWISSSRFLPQSPTALFHSHPHWQRTESHNRGFLRSALHRAHDLIHMVLTHLHRPELEQDRFTLSIAAYSADERFSLLQMSQESSVLMLSFLCPQCATDGQSGEWPRGVGHWTERMAPP